MWHGVYFKSAKDQMMNTSFLVNAAKIVFSYFGHKDGSLQQKNWWKKASILLNHITSSHPMCIQACWIWVNPYAASVVKRGMVQRIVEIEKRQLRQKGSYKRLHIRENCMNLSHAKSYNSRMIFFFYLQNNTHLSSLLNKSHFEYWFENWTVALLQYQENDWCRILFQKKYGKSQLMSVHSWIN